MTATRHELDEPTARVAGGRRRAGDTHEGDVGGSREHRLLVERIGDVVGAERIDAQAVDAVLHRIPLSGRAS